MQSGYLATVATARSPTESKAGQMPLAGTLLWQMLPCRATVSPWQRSSRSPHPKPHNVTLTQAGNPGHCLQVFSSEKGINRKKNKLFLIYWLKFSESKPAVEEQELQSRRHSSVWQGGKVPRGKSCGLTVLVALEHYSRQHLCRAATTQSKHRERKVFQKQLPKWALWKP